MKIEANLTTLGSYGIHFHKESKEVIEFLGKAELERLNHVEHLGLAASVFTGSNHSRLEYTLLQCAIIDLLPKFHKGNERFALSSSVLIPDQKTKVSSGEELLKCWALLGNAGHAKYTFGVERSLLNELRKNRNFRKLFVGELPKGFKAEASRIINEYDEVKFHYLLSLIKIGRLPKGSRLKRKLFRLMFALILPKSEQRLSGSVNRYKLFRLKDLYSRVRLISIVALDSYNSHHPLRYDVTSSLMNLNALFDDPGTSSHFLKLVESTAAWLADEIYMHPTAAAVQKSYEIAVTDKFKGGYSKAILSKEKFREFYPNFMQNGFGKPNIDKLSSLARLSFPRTKKGSIFSGDLFSITEVLEKQICGNSQARVSVLLNGYSDTYHVDLLFDRAEASASDIQILISNTSLWFRRLIDAQILYNTRGYTKKMPAELQKEFESLYRPKILHSITSRSNKIFRSLFDGLIKYILPEQLIGCFAEIYPNVIHSGVLVRMTMPSGDVYETIKEAYDTVINTNPDQLDADRLFELKLTHRIAIKSKAPLLLVCMDKFVVKDEFGKNIREWDGVIIEIYDSGVKITIVEAKNLSQKSSRANEAFRQLKDTQEMIKSLTGIQSRRRRIADYGAALTVSF